ncbi:MAG: MBL fold metallo-hydrolase [Lachnospiraceae bacterium]|nr:MBL fold metallo-hydrolase [Lachnospiraceae bacterium]
MNQVRVLHHSSIRISGEKKVIYIDPFRIKEDCHDADLVLITHEHYDHYSEEDVKKVTGRKTVLVAPESLEGVIEYSGKVVHLPVGDTKDISGVQVSTVAAYNVGKPFHPKESNWVGYLIDFNGTTYYICGDTDVTTEAKEVQCDVALVPIGGTYTMDVKEAAELVNHIHPKVAIPTHYGSVAGEKKDEEVFKSLVNKDIEVQIKMELY